MKLTTLAPGQHVAVNQDSGASSTAAREKAIAAVLAQPAAHTQPEQPIVQNQNTVQPEEMTAIKPTSEDTHSLETLPPEEVVEEVKEQEKEEKAPEQDAKIREQFARLARQERALRAKQQQQNEQFKAREAALAEREKSVQQPAAIPKDYIKIQDVKSNPLAILEQAGVSYEELTNAILNPVQTDPRMQALMSKQEERIAQLEAKLEESAQSQTKAQQSAYQQALNQISSDAKSLVKSNPEQFESIAKTGSVKDVVDLIERHYQKHGEVLSVEDAAREVEEYLTEELYNTTSRIEKIKRRLSPAPAPQKTVEVKPPAPKEQPQSTMKTLTNQTGTARKLNARERAILAMRGELK